MTNFKVKGGVNLEMEINLWYRYICYGRHRSVRVNFDQWVVKVFVAQKSKSRKLQLHNTYSNDSNKRW